MRSTLDTRLYLRNERDTHHNVWKGLCLALTRTARGLNPKYYSAWDNWQDAIEPHRLSGVIDWHTIPVGAPLWYSGPPHSDGKIYGHVTTFIGVTSVGPLCWSNDTRSSTPGSVNLVHPLWFPSHWPGHNLQGWSNDVEGVKLNLTIPHDPPQHRTWCSLSSIVKAARLDPDRSQGGTTPGCADDVRVVETALAKWGQLDIRLAHDGAFGSATISAYRLWQQACGFSGSDANGIPGYTSLSRLGARYGFHVVK